MASGATIIVLDGDVVVKANGGDRLNLQAEWLTTYASPGVVRVLGAWHGGYAMERLEPPIETPRPEEIVALLKRYVWRHSPVIEPRWENILGYAELKAKEWWPEVTDELIKGLQWCQDQTLTRCLVHGDPTIENVMSRFSDLVLIDPIPATEYAPDLLAVDLGKVLQSVCGYESVITGGWGHPENRSWLRTFNAAEQVAAKHFCLYHIVRLLPYLNTDDMRDRVKEIVGGNLRSI